jgi:hypothetical protein
MVTRLGLGSRQEVNRVWAFRHPDIGYWIYMPRLVVRRGPVTHPIGDSGRHLPVFELCMLAKLRFRRQTRKHVPLVTVDFPYPSSKSVVVFPIGFRAATSTRVRKHEMEGNRPPSGTKFLVLFGVLDRFSPPWLLRCCHLGARGFKKTSRTSSMLG